MGMMGMSNWDVPWIPKALPSCSKAIPAPAPNPAVPVILAHPSFSPWMNSLFPPLPAVSGMILSQISWKWNLPGIREGFSTRWARGGCSGSTSRWKIPLWKPGEALNPRNSIKTALLHPLPQLPEPFPALPEGFASIPRIRSVPGEG